MVREVRTDASGRAAALRLFPDPLPCEVCGKSGKGRGVIDRHHRNSDRVEAAGEPWLVNDAPGREGAIP